MDSEEKGGEEKAAVGPEAVAAAADACSASTSASASAPAAERSESQQEDSEDESEILEESPCGRWLKRREEVSVSVSSECALP